MSNKKSCKKCIFLHRYTSRKGNWVDICEAEEPEEEDDGVYHVIVIDQDEFDSKNCLNFKEVKVL